MNATQIRQVLEETGVNPSKSLGQNFLVDENIARWIVSQLEIEPTDCVVEVGPGEIKDGKLIPMTVKVGNKVIVAKYAGTEVKIEEETYIIVKEDDILAIVE